MSATAGRGGDGAEAAASRESLREPVVALAEAAGRAILAVYSGDFAVEDKDDRSPLTEADLASQRLLVAGLEALTPDLPVLSEEAAEVPWAVRRAWPRLWLVDPLDGTREFVKRNGEFCVCLALIEDGVPVLGVVHAPVAGVTWSALAGRGAWRRVAASAQERPLARRPPLAAGPAGLRVAASRSHRDARTDALLARLPGAETLAMGSAIKFGLLAEGALDVYPRFGPTAEWDTAAGQCLVEAVGGAVLGLDGAPLRYNRRPGLANGAFLALADPDLPWRTWLD
ncbi:MAG: 3'(2'),5'-bisphosphate nucleotidase CysQ [Xanthomonadaceae bacterium]|jgi:3'(2'), 5'-bisphosphate nucleotidase|nr:3'(2'),5'-bisphosphate nucleotidase CysQ [Xanthomonadaceae bacterium]